MTYDDWKSTDDTPEPDPNRCESCEHPEGYCDCRPCCVEPTADLPRLQDKDGTHWTIRPWSATDPRRHRKDFLPLATVNTTDYVESACHRDNFPAWFGGLGAVLSALGWQGGTVHQAWEALQDTARDLDHSCAECDAAVDEALSE